MDVRQDTDEDNRRDFNQLKRQLSAASSPTDSSSVITVNSTRTDIVDSEVWPLQLNTQLIDHYILGDVIGNGSYAEVHECIDTRNLARCAVKVVNKNYLKRQNPGALDNQLQEIRLLRCLNHPNIIAMKECLFKGPKIYIILEHCTFLLSDMISVKGDPEHQNSDSDSAHNGQPFCPSLTRNLFNQIILGLDYLHSSGIVHRDIKPQNMLITTSGTLKIIDFGVSKILSMWSQSDLCSNYEGSPLFQAPEVVTGQMCYHGFKVDIWSAGVTLYLMLFGRYPFLDDSLLGLYDKILADDFVIPKKDPNDDLILEDLLSKMLNKISDQRATTKTILSHPWLKYQDTSQGLNEDPHSEFIEMTQNFTSHVDAIVKNPITDVYKSMSVLPYLHAYHFPDLPTVKANKRRLKPGSQPVSPTSDLNSDRSSGTSSPSPAGSHAEVNREAEANPHQVIEDRPIEWGTEGQYKLLKVPLIRANRLRAGRKVGRWKINRHKGWRRKKNSLVDKNRLEDGNS